MPFCPNCGAEIEPSDVFCGKCGSKISVPPENPENSLDGSSITNGLKGLAHRAREQTASIRSEIGKKSQSMGIIKSAEGVLSSIRGRVGTDSDITRGINSIDAFSGVFAWVVKTHVKALKGLAEEIAPHLISHNCLDGNNLRLDWAESCPATVENLLMFLPHVEIGLKHLGDFAEIKQGVSLTLEDLWRLKVRLEELLDVYLSTKDALKELHEAANPIDNYLYDLGEISRKQDVSNVRKLSKYEKAMNNFIKNVGRIDWGKHSHEDPAPIVDVAVSHNLVVISMEVETSYHHVQYQYPYINTPAFSTDVERYTAPFFTFIETIDESYSKCKTLFEKCKSNSGLFKDPDQGLTKEAIKALSTFNTQYHGVFSAYSYSYSNDLRLEKSGEVIHQSKEILKKLDQSMKKIQSSGSMGNAEELIQLVYKFVLLLNEVEPVLKSRAAYPW